MEAPQKKLRDVAGSQEAQRDSVSRLILGARDGCETSLSELTERYRRYLLLVANCEISRDLQAKVAPSDLVQETFLHAGTRFERFTGSSEQELLAWLRRILHFRALHAARRFQQVAGRQINREIPLTANTEISPSGIADHAPTPPSRIVEQEDRAAMHLALERLPAEARQIIVLRTLERKGFSAIGEILGCSADAARKRWVRALSQLRNEWKHDE